jgi:hypothetical protein
LDSVEFFLYDTAGKEEFGDITEAHVSLRKVFSS